MPFPHFLVVFLKKITKKEGEAGDAVTLCFRLMVAATTVAFRRGPEKFRLQKFSREEAWLIPNNKREMKQKQKERQRSVSPLFSKDLRERQKFFSRIQKWKTCFVSNEWEGIGLKMASGSQLRLPSPLRKWRYVEETQRKRRRRSEGPSSSDVEHMYARAFP